MLTHYLRKRVSVITADGRNLVGVLHAADQLLNIVLTSCVERVLTRHDAPANAAQGMEEVSIGVIMLRGADVVSVGLIDVYAEAEARPSEWEGRDIPPVCVTPRSV